MASAIYARQSVDRPDSISVDTQIERCRQRLPAAALPDCRVYTDRGFSGKNTDRPAFQRLLRDIRAGEIDRVAVYKLDRISRSVHDFTGLCGLLREKQVQFCSCEDGLTLDDTPAGMAMAQILMVFAQFERETIQRRVTDNYYARAKSGLYLGGRPPFGFIQGDTLVDGRKTACYLPQAKQAALIPELYERYLAPGGSLGTLMRFLNDEKRLPAPRGGPWGTVQLGRLLRNPAYARADAAVCRYLLGKGAQPTDPIECFTGTHGCYLYAPRSGRTRSKLSDPTGAFFTLAPHEGLVDAPIWLAAQQRLDAARSLRGAGRGANSWLSGLMRCAHCGYAITVVAKPGSALHYINCGGRKKGKSVCPGRARTITLEEIEGAVAPALADHLRALQSAPVPLSDRRCAARNQLEMRIAAAEQARDRLAHNLAQIEQDDVVALLAAQLHAQQQALAQLEAERHALTAPDADADAAFAALRQAFPHLSIAEKKLLARAAIQQVIVGDDTIEIEFRAQAQKRDG